MGKRKIEKIARIQNNGQRKVTLCKRKKGLLKKTIELSVLCDLKIFLYIYDPTQQRVTHFASHEDQNLLELFNQGNQRDFFSNKHYSLVGGNPKDIDSQFAADCDIKAKADCDPFSDIDSNEEFQGVVQKSPPKKIDKDAIIFSKKRKERECTSLFGTLAQQRNPIPFNKEQAFILKDRIAFTNDLQACVQKPSQLGPQKQSSNSIDSNVKYPSLTDTQSFCPTKPQGTMEIIQPKEIDSSQIHQIHQDSAKVSESEQDQDVHHNPRTKGQFSKAQLEQSILGKRLSKNTPLVSKMGTLKRPNQLLGSLDQVFSNVKALNGNQSLITRMNDLRQNQFTNLPKDQRIFKNPTDQTNRPNQQHNVLEDLTGCQKPPSQLNHQYETQINKKVSNMPTFGLTPLPMQPAPRFVKPIPQVGKNPYQYLQGLNTGQIKAGQLIQVGRPTVTSVPGKLAYSKNIQVTPNTIRNQTLLIPTSSLTQESIGHMSQSIPMRPQGQMSSKVSNLVSLAGNNYHQPQIPNSGIVKYSQGIFNMSQDQQSLIMQGDSSNTVAKMVVTPSTNMIYNLNSYVPSDATALDRQINTQSGPVPKKE